MVRNDDISFKTVIIPISLFIIFFLFYASFTKIDELVKGEGKIVTSSKTQIIQHLEGGILKDVLVKEGEHVKKGQNLLEIKNTFFLTALNEKKIEKLSLEAKIDTMYSLYNSTDLNLDDNKYKLIPDIVSSLVQIYNEELESFNNNLSKYEAKLKEEEFILRNNTITLANKDKTYKDMKERFEITSGLYERNDITKNEFLDARIKFQDIKTEIEELKNKKPVIQKKISQIEEEINVFRNETKLKYLTEINKTQKDLEITKEKITALKDRSGRMVVVSPSDGIINKIHKNTIGSAIKEGEDIIEITPIEDSVLVEAEISDRDRSKIWVGQKVKIEVKAYDYSNYGFLEGEIESISPDSFIKKSDRKVFYIVKIKTGTNKIKGQPLIFGMTANVNILVGQKTIMEYLLKPIKNIKKSAFTEI